MRKALLISLFALLFASCVSTKTNAPTVTGIENLKREDYTVMPEAKTCSRGFRVWILFIPIGYGKSDKVRESKAFNKMLKPNHADGVLAAKYKHKKITVSLILLTYTNWTTTLNGKPYVLKTDKIEPVKK